MVYATEVVTVASGVAALLLDVVYWECDNIVEGTAAVLVSVTVFVVNGLFSGLDGEADR